MTERSGEAQTPALFGVLVRHFLERLWNNELASASGDAKLRMVQAACVAGLPGFVMALYLYPVYHPPRGYHRAYWAMVGDHWFYTVYSFTAMGLMTLFAWDFFFPDRLDVYALGALPLRGRLLFRARIAAVVVFLGAALFDANFLAPLVLPAATDPPRVALFLLAHLVTVAMSGICGAAMVLALQGLLLALLGGRAYARISVTLQAVLGTALFGLLLTAPAMGSAMQGLLEQHVRWAAWLPPLWFLGVYQRLLQGSVAKSLYSHLGLRACAATLISVTLAAAVYPAAYRRRVRELAEGGGLRRRARQQRGGLRLGRFERRAESRGVWAFVSQTVARVPRYRTYLAMYGGLGLALLAASAARFAVSGGEVHVEYSPDGLRASVAVAAFWTASGLRAIFLAPAERRPGWLFRLLGRPGTTTLGAGRRWALGATMAVSFAAAGSAIALGEPGMRSAAGIAVQAVMAAGLSLLLVDGFWFGVRTLPFQNAVSPPPTRIAWVMAIYLGLLPMVISGSLALEAWMETRWVRMLLMAIVFPGMHVLLRWLDRLNLEAWLREPEMDEDAEEFPQRLGLRY